VTAQSISHFDAVIDDCALPKFKGVWTNIDGAYIFKLTSDARKFRLYVESRSGCDGVYLSCIITNWNRKWQQELREIYKKAIIAKLNSNEAGNWISDNQEMLGDVLWDYANDFPVNGKCGACRDCEKYYDCTKPKLKAVLAAEGDGPHPG